MKNETHCIGLMSGTSLDGVDVCYCSFEKKKTKWEYQIIENKTFPYSEIWKDRLVGAPKLSGTELSRLHLEYGSYLGELTKKFITKHKANPAFVSSHGHTIFHQPEKGITLQIGHGGSIAASTGITTICDFRTQDVKMGGQGAPLVPIGDKLLFSEYDFCLNLGGFANISFEEKGKRKAFDICPCNVVLNQLSKTVGKDFDNNGALARKGSVNPKLLSELNKLKFYSLEAPKSLGREFVERNINPVINKHDNLNDTLRTFCEHIAFQIVSIINKNTTANSKMLITGGGAHNQFLTELIQKMCNAEIIIPDKRTVDFKEALVFAFLGLLRMNNQNNCLASVTGAKQDHCGGSVFLP
ncbi:MAG: anhydro-N-acetylmuramic acid kinase [Bacteroidota bacterium]